MVIAVNGTTVTVSINGTAAFTYTFAPRLLDGLTVGLNHGLIGVGSNMGRAQFDNVRIQQLPPQLTVDRTQDFGDGTAGGVTGAGAGGRGGRAGGHHTGQAGGRGGGRRARP